MVFMALGQCRKFLKSIIWLPKELIREALFSGLIKLIRLSDIYDSILSKIPC
jgi:hypothetical protein